MVPWDSNKEQQMLYPEKDLRSHMYLLAESKFNDMETTDNHKMRNFLF